MFAWKWILEVYFRTSNLEQICNYWKFHPRFTIPKTINQVFVTIYIYTNHATFIQLIYICYFKHNTFIVDVNIQNIFFSAVYTYTCTICKKKSLLNSYKMTEEERCNSSCERSSSWAYIFLISNELRLERTLSYYNPFIKSFHL